MSELALARAVGALAGMTVQELPVGFALMKGERMAMHVFCVLTQKLELPSVPYVVMERLRSSAVSGLQARAVFASPQGVFVKKVGPAQMDGWIGLEGGQMVVSFGSLKVGDKIFNEEAEPLSQLPINPSPEWFQ